MNGDTMEKDKEFYESIMRESCSLQGMYGRFYHLEYMQWSEDYQDRFVEAMDEAGVKDLMDYIMFMEA